MGSRPRFKRRYGVTVVDGEAVYLVSERGHSVIQEAVVRDLASYLDGTRELDEVVDALAGRHEPERVYHAVHSLRRLGYVCDADPSVDPGRAGFWEMAGRDGDEAERALALGAIQPVLLGAIPVAALLGAAAATGLRVAEEAGALRVVLVDDYLDPALEQVNREALAAGRPWLLARPAGTVVWVGPVFRPGDTACWSCLAQRVRTNRQVESYVAERAGRRVAAPTAALPASVGAGLQLAVLQAAKWLAGVGRDDPPAVVTLDALTLESARHLVVRRPQCPDCGDHRLQAHRQWRPVVLEPRPKAYTEDGGHRSARPQEVVREHLPKVSPITGAVSRLRKTPVDIDLVHHYGAGHNFALHAPRLRDLREGLRTRAAGKGMSDVQAQASGLCEAIERYSGLFHGDEARIRASFRQLGAAAIHPNACTLFSERQLRERAAWNERASTFSTVADPLDEDAVIEWSPVWSLTGSRFRYLPTMYLYFHYPKRDGSRFCWADSNGNAAGTSIEDAVLQGLLELVERDSAALWWYSRVRRPRIDLASFDEPFFERFLDTYRRCAREAWVLDLTADLGIPAVAAVSRRVDKPVEDILVSFGAHLDARVAVVRALTEMNQFLPAVLPVRSDGTGDYAFPDPDSQRWWRTATTENQPYLVPDDRAPARGRDSFPDLTRPDLRDDVATVRSRIEAGGMEVLVLDQTRPDIGLPVVKTIAPGMRHFWARFGPGRLYDVPVELGWLSRRLREDELNPIPMFI